MKRNIGLIIGIIFVSLSILLLIFADRISKKPSIPQDTGSIIIEDPETPREDPGKPGKDPQSHEEEDNKKLKINCPNSIKIGDELDVSFSIQGIKSKDIKWEVNDKSKATINSAGHFIPLKEGSVKVTATSDKLNSSCIIEIKPIDITKVDIDKYELSIFKDNTYQFKATTEPSNATNKTLKWSSSDPKVVEVDQNGKIKALKEGSAVISVTSSNNISAYCKVTVRNKIIPKCSGVADRNGTLLTVDTTGQVGVKSYKWNLDGMIATTNSNQFLHSYKGIQVGKVSLIYNDNSEVETTCTIEDKLLFRFNVGYKDLIPCGAYSRQDADKLNEALAQAVQDAGYGTRAGVVEAARFLMGLPYNIPYQGASGANLYEMQGLNVGNNNAWGCQVNGRRAGMDCVGLIKWPFYQNGLQGMSSFCGDDGIHSLREYWDNVRVGDALAQRNNPNDDTISAKLCTYSHDALIIGIYDNAIYAMGNSLVVINRDNIPQEGYNSLAYVRTINYPAEGNITNMFIQ